MRSEPVITIASVQALIAAVLTGLVAFGVWEPSEDQTAAIFGLYAVVAPMLFGVFARGRVTPYEGNLP